MAIPTGTVRNFETLRAAFKAGHVALMECTDNTTGETVDVICMVNSADGGSSDLVPVAAMVRANPYTRWTPPMDEVDEAEESGHVAQ